MWSRSDHTRAKPSFSRGVRGHAPPENFENRDAQICVFSPFGSLNKGSNLVSWIMLKLKVQQFGTVELNRFCVCALLWASHLRACPFSRRQPFRADLVFWSLSDLWRQIVRNVNDVKEFKRCWNPFLPHLPALSVCDSTLTTTVWKCSSTGSFVEPELTSGSWVAVRSDSTWLYLKIDSLRW